MTAASEHARRLVRSSFVWDNHACLPLRPEDPRFLPELERLRAVGVDAVTLNVGYDGVPWPVAIKMLATFRDHVARHPDRYRLVAGAADLGRDRADGRLAVLFDIEGGAALDGHLPMLRLYRDLGVRWMLVAYNRPNALGGGCQTEDGGLTAFGQAVVAEMERLGIIVCLSHTGRRTMLDVLDRATRPTILSHSNPAAVWPHPRNVDDELIRRCAATGGVVGINGIGLFLGRNDASPARFADHVLHVVDLVGPAHVGLGLDFVFDASELDEAVAANPAMFPPADGYAAGIRMMSPEAIPAVVDALLDRGMGDDEVAGLLGGNWLRVARACWG